MKFLVFFVLALAYAQADVNEYNDKNANTISQHLEIAPDGSQYSHGYETSNRIKSEVSAVLTNANSDNPALEEQGQFAYLNNEGKVVSLEYTAGVGGFQPRSDVLPTPPPTPELIARLLKYLEQNYRPKTE